MALSSTIADALLGGDEAALADVLSGPLVVARNNFVERPWGGTRLREYKRLHPLPDQLSVSGQGIGEAFELAACDDEEAARFPSRVVFADGSTATLSALLAVHGRRILGDAFVDRYGPRLPLLPKTLNIRELLSVQGHPAGHTEVYIIVAADPGATIALGFHSDIDPGAFAARLHAGLERQAALTALLAPEADPFALHGRLAAWFAAGDAGPAPDTVLPSDLLVPGADPANAHALLAALRQDYWSVLDAMNHIEVRPGQVIYNATPARLLAEGQAPSAEVHALGNPAAREIVALEVRLPGPTYRAWDNVRFPQRAVDVDAALAALNTAATAPDDFIREEIPDASLPGVSVSVDNEFFRVAHLRPDAQTACALPAGDPCCLLVLEGEAVFRAADGRTRVRVARGEAALVPAGLGEAWLAADAAAHVVCVTLPCRA